MEVRWTERATYDLVRLHAFLAPVAPAAADQAIVTLAAAARRLADFPRIGTRIAREQPNEVRRLLVGRYDMRYEIRDGVVFVLRVWHTREDR